MWKKHVNKTNYKSTIGAIITIVIFVILSYCYAKINVRQEPGPNPVWIKWNNKTYTTTGETVRSIDRKLGVSESTSTVDQRVVYSITNISSDKKIAIGQLWKQYFSVFASK